jgi:alcohol dehydrogenase
MPPAVSWPIHSSRADTAIEAVGIPATFEMCGPFIPPRGLIANIGGHAAPVALHLERLWDRNITITTRLAATISTPMLLDIVASHKADLIQLITHRPKLDQIVAACATFARVDNAGALKLIIEV